MSKMSKMSKMCVAVTLQNSGNANGTCWNYFEFFSASTYNANTSIMDATLGIVGYQIG